MRIPIAQSQLITFVLFDTLGMEVTGLDDAFTVEISKNGGAFGAGTGAKDEISDGWYGYTLSAAETDTAGPLAVKVTGAGVIQNNLLYQVVGSLWTPSGTNILSTTEAADILRCEATDPNMLMLLPQIDAYIQMATGRDWTADATIYPEAKSAARILLVQGHEDPGAMSQPAASLDWGLQSCLLQLQVKAMELESAGVPFEPLALFASQPSTRSEDVAIDANLVLIFNHAMSASATSAVSLEDAAGATMASANSLDVTGHILTINPTGSLTAGARYTLFIDHAPDIFGQTLEKQISFETAD